MCISSLIHFSLHLKFQVISTSTIPYTKYLSKEVQIAAMRASSKNPSSTSASTSSSASTTPIGTLNNAPFASLAAAATAVATSRPVGQIISRRLRKRGAKNYAENARNTIVHNVVVPNGSFVVASGSTAAPSTTSVIPIASPSNLSGGAGNVSVTDLQSTVTEYFGAANRIENGEKFMIKGKRLAMDGKIEYLIEWQDIC